MSTPLSILTLHLTDYEDYVEIFVNHKPIAEVIEQPQRNGAAKYVYEDSGLGWLNVDHLMFWTAFDRTLSDRPADSIFLLTNCGCNVIGCGEVFVHLTITPDLITWHTIETNHGRFPLPPLHFSRSQYEDEIERTHKQFAERRAEEDRVNREQSSH